MNECHDPGGCMEAIEQLYQFLDGELTDDKRVQITRHLDDCQPCLDAYGFEGDLRQVIAAKCKDRVPQSLVDRVAEALRQESSGPIL